MSFSFRERRQAIQFLKTNPVELLVIGGGVVGCSVAAHAAALGLSCALIEREDIAAGASGHSTGLAHAGLRYLAQGRVLYVLKEARERLLLEQLAPHWVRPFNFIFPVYRGDAFGLRSVRLGTWIYNQLYRLAAVRMGRPFGTGYKVLNPQELAAKVPGIQTEGLEGGTEYFVDARLDDVRFTLGFAQKAAENGARIVTHAEIQSFRQEEGRLAGADVRDRLTGEVFSIGARLVVNAAGPWIDSIRVLTGLASPVLNNSKGIHLLVDRVAPVPLILSGRTPGQVFFIIPFDRDGSLLGTTDTPHPGNPDQARTTPADAEELMRELFRFFPHLKEKGVRIHQTYWGLRPLVRQARATVHASREHALVREANGLWSVPGVKLTAGRAAGEQVALEAWRFLRKTASGVPNLGCLPGGEKTDQSPGSWPADIWQYLAHVYGSRRAAVIRFAEQEVSLRERVVPGRPWIFAEAAYAVEEEMVLTLNDFLWRRARWARVENVPDKAQERMAEVLGRFLNWSSAEKERQLQQFREEWAAHQLPR